MAIHEVTREVGVFLLGPKMVHTMRIKMLMSSIQEAIVDLSRWADGLLTHNFQTTGFTQSRLRNLKVTDQGRKIVSDSGLLLLEVENDQSKEKMVTFARGQTVALVDYESLLSCLKLLDDN